MRNKILGMLVGGAIGDALGMPVETWTPERIKEVHPGGVRGYLTPIEHTWFCDTPDHPTKTYMPAGSMTDDTQLTIATVKGIIDGYSDAKHQKSTDPFMDAIAVEHVKAMNASTTGWGKSTVEAIQRLESGSHWSASGATPTLNRGTGNGIPMKCSPLAAWQCCKTRWLTDVNEEHVFDDRILAYYAAMTHFTKMAIQSCFVHTHAIEWCLHSLYGMDDLKYFMEAIYSFAFESEKNSRYLIGYNDTKDDLCVPFKRLTELLPQLNSMSVDDIRREFGNGSCYVYDSLPFSYAWFLRDPGSFETILDTVNAGGDTDTNAKMVGELLGALHGIEFFENTDNRWAIEGLPCFEELIHLGNRLCDTLGLE